MGLIKQTVVEVVGLGAFAVAIALAGNHFRSSGSIRLTKNYFQRDLSKLFPPAAPSQARSTPSLAGDQQPDTPQPNHKGLESPRQRGLTGEGRLDHPYQEVTLEQVAEILNDPDTELGLNVFVDARKKEAYAEGHIPGAIQVDHYELQEYVETLLERTSAADKIIVYCNGGDCEDSIFLCGDLLELGLSYRAIYLYADGWKEWKSSDMPIATGPEEK